jgi:hypothetical protein
MVRKNGGGSSLTRAWKKAEEGSGLRGSSVGMTEGGAHPFIGARGAPGRRQRMVMAEVMAFKPLMAMEGLRGGLNRGFKAWE